MIGQMAIFVGADDPPLEIDARGVPKNIAQVRVFGAEVRIHRFQSEGARGGEVEEENRMGRSVAEVLEGDEKGVEIERPAEAVAKGGIGDLVEHPLPLFLKDKNRRRRRGDHHIRLSHLHRLLISMARLRRKGEIFGFFKPLPKGKKLAPLVPLPLALVADGHPRAMDVAVPLFLLSRKERVRFFKQHFQLHAERVGGVKLVDPRLSLVVALDDPLALQAQKRFLQWSERHLQKGLHLRPIPSVIHEKEEENPLHIFISENPLQHNFQPLSSLYTL